MYSVPIPISYLINESRVKDTIISSGWVEGFKSIFHSEEKIRDIRRQLFLNKAESSKTSTNLTREQEIGSQSEKLFYKSGKNIKVAIVSYLQNISFIEAEKLLDQNKGFLNRII